MDFSKLSVKKIRELIIFTALLAAALWKFEVVIDVLKQYGGSYSPLRWEAQLLLSSTCR